MSLTSIRRIGPAAVTKLKAAGIESIEDVLVAPVDELIRAGMSELQCAYLKDAACLHAVLAFRSIGHEIDRFSAADRKKSAEWEALFAESAKEPTDG